jgi:hypothetical protein
VNWLSQNYQWIFSGIGVLVLGFVVQQWLSRKDSKTEIKTTTNFKDSALANSPVATGQNNTQTLATQTFNAETIHIGHPAVPAPAPVQPPATIQRLLPNITLTSARPVRITQISQGVWSETYRTHDALIVQFTNEARAGGQNVGGLVKALVVYRDADKVLRSGTGCWLDEHADMTEFRVDESHSLMVGWMFGGQFRTVAKRRVRVDTDKDAIQTDMYDLPNFQIGTVSVRLTHAKTGDFLYEGQFRVSVNPLTIVSQ